MNKESDYNRYSAFEENKEQNLLAVCRRLLSKEFNLVSQINCVSGTYQLINIAEKNLLASMTGLHDSAMREVVKVLLAPEDQQEFLEHTLLENIKRKLEESGGSYDYYYMSIVDGNSCWCQIQVCYAEEDKKYILLADRDCQHIFEANKLQNKLKEIRGEEDCYDEMTGLLKYAYFQEKSIEMMRNAKEGQKFGVVYSDIHNFKYINSLYGYQKGNQMLRDLAELLDKNGHRGYAARVVSDSFVKIFMLDSEEEMDQCYQNFEKILQQFVAAKQKEYPDCHIEIACGGSEVIGGIKGLMRAIDNASIAHKIARNDSKTRCVYFDKKMEKQLEKETEFAIDIKHALQKGEFVFYLQPKINLQTGKIVGAEALARWAKQDGTVVMPEEFIKIMQQDGSIVDLDFFIYEQVCRYLAECIKAEEAVVTVSVNVSGQHFRHPDFVKRVNDIVNKYHIHPSLLEFELTESILMEKTNEVAAILKELKNMGYKTAIDDFGSEYSSLSMITELDVDVLKIDRSLLGDSNTVTPKKRAVISSIAEMANKLHLAILAEGTETLEQALAVREEGCGIAQGFYFAKPLTIKRFKDLLKKNNGYIELPWKDKDKKSVWHMAAEYKDASELTDSVVTAISNSMFYILPGGVTGFDPKTGELLFVSDGMFEIAGYNRTELMDSEENIKYGGLFDMARVEEYHKTIIAMLKRDTRAVIEYPIVKKDGSGGWVKLYAGYANSPEWGQYLLCIVFDDTSAHRRQIELSRTLKEIVEQKRFHEEMYNSIVCGIIQIERKGEELIYYYINDEGIKQLGYETRDKFWSNASGGVMPMIHQDDLEKVTTIMKTLPVGEMEYFEYRIRQLDGSTMWVACMARAIMGTDGNEMIQMAAVDISERRYLEEKLKKERDFYDQLYSSMPCGIIQFDPTYSTVHLLNVNVAAAAIFGYDSVEDFKEHIEGKDNSILIYKEDVNRSDIIKNQLHKVGDKAQFEYRINTKKGEIRWINGVREFLQDTNGKLVMQGTFMDSTERQFWEETRRNEEYTKNALKIAEEANLAKSRFLSNMSHDIRTPMNAIMGMVKIVKMHSGDAEKVNSCMEKIDVSSKHLLNLINDVLDMSRIESGKIALSSKPCSIKEHMEHIDAIMRPQAEEKKQKLTIFAEDLIHDTAIMDELHMKQIVINVLSNAVKFTKEEGIIKYKIKEIPCKIKGKAHYIMTVSDNGRGMSNEFQQQLFDPFTREQDSIGNNIEGTGLGMSIAKSIVDLMGGKISVESELQKGTIFTMEFVIPFQEQDLSEQVSDVERVFDFRGKRILIVEDNELNQEIFKELLDMEGACVEVANNGKEAVEKYEAVALNYYHMIFMDIQMPIMDGYEATKAIRASRKGDGAEIPIIAMTANTFTDDIIEGLDAGMNAHIPKPLDMAVLHETLLNLFV